MLYSLCIPSILVWPFIAFNQTHLPQLKNAPQPRSFDFSRRTVLEHRKLPSSVGCFIGCERVIDARTCATPILWEVGYRYRVVANFVGSYCLSLPYRPQN